MLKRCLAMCHPLMWSALVGVWLLLSSSTAATPATPFPEPGALPPQAGLPDPFLRPDGTRVALPDEWPSQREHLKAMLLHYMYGQVPPRPTAAQRAVELVGSQPVPGLDAVEEHYRLTLSRNGLHRKFDFWVIRPDTDEKLPAIVKNDSRSFHEPEPDLTLTGRALRRAKKAYQTAKWDLAAAQEAVRRGYLMCKFDREHWAGDRAEGARRDIGAYALYPKYDWGAIAIWGWAHGVMLDVLNEDLGLIDPHRVVATGHSRGGQAATAAGALDERLAIIAPSAGGYGSTSSYRIRDENDNAGKDDIFASNARNHPHWYHARRGAFAGQGERFPFDTHTQILLSAPRPYLNVNAIDDEHNNTLGVEAGIRAAREAYRLWGAEDQVRVHWRPGTHAQKTEDWNAILDFADEMFHGKPGKSKFNQWQYPGYDLGLTWSAP